MNAPTMAAPGLCYCGAARTEGHVCQYTQGRGWCPRCLADHDDPQCCTPDRLTRIVRTRPCGHRVDDGCGCSGWKPSRDERPGYVYRDNARRTRVPIPVNRKEST